MDEKKRAEAMKGLATWGWGFLMIDPRRKPLAAPFGIENVEHLALFLAESNPTIEWVAKPRSQA